jgi:hypothetical protein
VQEELCQRLFDHIPVGVGSEGVIPMTAKELDEILEMGIDWSIREGYRKEHKPRLMIFFFVPSSFPHFSPSPPFSSLSSSLLVTSPQY